MMAARASANPTGNAPAIRAVVFDFDGVLADSEPLHLQAFQDALSELDVRLDRDEYYDRYLGFDDAGVFRVLSEHRGLGWTEARVSALVGRKTEIFDARLDAADVLYPGAVECVRRLAEAYPLGIASGALRHEIETILRRHRLDRHIRFIVAAGETPASKPAPDPYQRAAALHGLPPHACVAIEDSRWGIESAKGAGLHCVGITHTYAAPELSRADTVIDSLDAFTVQLIDRLGR